MMSFVKKMPIPISGVMLALASLGNLLGPRMGMNIRWLFGGVATLFCVLLILKIIFYTDQIKENFQNPVVAGVMGTFPMALMILSTYAVFFSALFGFVLWWLGILLHFLLIVAFTLKYKKTFKSDKIFPTHFIVYVGFVCASVAAPLHGMEIVGQALWFLGALSYGILLPLIIYRVFKHKNIPEPAQPTIAILAAPGSLCAVGYVASFGQPTPIVGLVLFLFAALGFMLALFQMPRLMKLPFYPSFSAFTFPFVISAIAFTMLNSSAILLMASTGLAVVLTLFVLGHYLKLQFV